MNGSMEQSVPMMNQDVRIYGVYLPDTHEIILMIFGAHQMQIVLCFGIIRQLVNVFLKLTAKIKSILDGLFYAMLHNSFPKEKAIEKIKTREGGYDMNLNCYIFKFYRLITFTDLLCM